MYRAQLRRVGISYKLDKTLAASLYHYTLKSEQDFVQRAWRGGGLGGQFYRDDTYFHATEEKIRLSGDNCTELRDLMFERQPRAGNQSVSSVRITVLKEPRKNATVVLTGKSN